MKTLQIQIEKEISRILSNYTTSKKKYSYKEINLYGGLAGQILMLGVGSLTRNNTAELDKFFDDIEYSLDIVEQNFTKLNPTFSGGLSGWAWVLVFLAKKNVVDVPRDFFREIDSVLEIQLAELLRNDNYDQLNGALGIARYFISRNKIEVLNKVVSYLDEKAIRINKEVIWNHVPWYDKNKPFYDFGLAHGIPGILYVLYKCYQLGVNKAKCSELIHGGLKFLFANIQDIKKVGSYFPNKIEASKYQEGDFHENLSRLAWCYGDLGAFYVVHEISKYMGYEQYVKLSEGFLLQTTNRKSFETTYYYDAGFCHGTAGIAHLYNRLYIKTGKEAFRDATIFWFRKTLEYVEDSESNGNYKYLVGAFEERKLQENKELLEGDAGVALSYISFLDPELSDWDECMMLS